MVASMTTANAMHPLTNRIGTYWVKDMRVQVRVTDVRDNRGNLEVQITPVAGSGTTWVRAYNVELDPVAS